MGRSTTTRTLVYPGILVLGLGVACSRGAPVSQVPDTVTAADAPDARGMDPAFWCTLEPGEGPDALPVIPRPHKVLAMGSPVPLRDTTVSWSGGGEDGGGALLTVAGDLRLEVVPSGGALQVDFQGAQAWDALCQGCPEDLAGIAGAYALRVEADPSGARAEVLAGDAVGRYYAVQTLRQLISAEPAPRIQPVTIVDRPAIGLRGVLEGFYGAPWAPEDRLAMISQIAALKMNTFVYAPKGAGSINTAWMLPFSEEELEHFEELSVAASRHHVRFCFEIHPSFLFHYSTEADFQTLVEKFEDVLDRGIDCVVLAFDDVTPTLIPPDTEVFDDYSSAQADFVPRLGEALEKSHPGLLLAYVPTEYYTLHADAESALPKLGLALPSQWAIAWTGREIIPSTITRADADAFAALIGRPPLLGDNYPVSDDAWKTGIVHLGPLTGRAPDLLQGLSGIAFNAMPLAFASLPATATAADYSWNPEAYEAGDSMGRAARLYAGDGGASALSTLCAVNRSPLLDGGYAPALEAAVDAFEAAWADQSNINAAAEALAVDFFGPFSEVAGVFEGDGFHPSVEELKPWAEKLGAYGDAGLLALELLEGVRTGDGGGDVEGFTQVVETLSQDFARPTGPVMEDFLAFVLEALP